MSSRSGSSSCFGSALLILVGLILIRFGLPGIWKILAAFFSTALYAGVFLFVILIGILGYYTYKNLNKTRKTVEEVQYSRITRTQELYASVVERLQRDMVTNQVSAEELLQSEILVSETLKEIKLDLIRLKDFASPKNEKALNMQLQEYKQEMQRTQDSSVRQVIEENMKLLQEKKLRMQQTGDEIRQKEAMVDLVYHSLLKAEEDLKMGRPVQRLLPPDTYQRFGLTAPRERGPLPPMKEKSNLE